MHCFIYWEILCSSVYIAIVPVTVMSTARASTDVPFHPSYSGKVLFINKFDGQLAASDYPKVNFYLIMFLAYLTLGAAWGWICWQNRDELLPIQYYLSSLVGFLIIEMVASWGKFQQLHTKRVWHRKHSVLSLYERSWAELHQHCIPLRGRYPWCWPQRIIILHVTRRITWAQCRARVLGSQHD